MNRNSNQKAMVVVPRKKQQKQDKERFDPPSFLSLSVYFRRMRFHIATSNSQEVVIISAGGICAALGFVPDNANDRAYCCARNIKIKKIQIWAAPKSDSSDAFKTATIDWHNSTGYCSGKKKTDTSISNAKPLYISSRPPTKSVSDFWIESFNTQIVTLTIPQGAIVDVQVNYTQSEGVMNYVSMSNFTATPAANSFLYGRLDFNSPTNAGGVLIPVDLATL